MRKKLLFLALLLLSFSGVFAGTTVMTERAYQWRNDDGDAATATPRANDADKGITVNTTDEIFRLRIRIEGDGIETDTEDLGDLEYGASLTGGYTKITDPSSPFSLANSANITGGQATVEMLTATNPGTFQAGKFFTADSPAKIAIIGGNSTELEFVLKLNAKAASNTTYFIRLSGIKNSANSDGTPIPRVTTSVTLPVGLLNFDAKLENDGIGLTWSTSSEQNNEKFIVQRSSDGVNWVTISTIEGANNSTSNNQYSIVDRNPSNGVNYYNLKQYDFDGTEKLLATKSVKFSLKPTVASLSVYPNPTISDIKFNLAGFEEPTFKALLLNTQGKIIHQETFASKNAEETYRLNLKGKPVSGLYILKIQGKNVAFNKRVIVN